jgi:hypothetical protein
MADLGETTAFLLPSRRHLSQNRPPAHQNELGTSVGDLPCEACRRFPAGNMRTHVQVSPSQGGRDIFSLPLKEYRVLKYGGRGFWEIGTWFLGNRDVVSGKSGRGFWEIGTWFLGNRDVVSGKKLATTQS